MSKFKNVIFDLGGVLLDIDYQRVLAAFQNLGITDFDPLYRDGDVRNLFQRMEDGSIPLPRFYQQFGELTGKHVTPGQFDEAWNTMLVGFRKSSLDYLDRLRNQANLFLLSNTSAIHHIEFTKMYKRLGRKQTFEENFIRCFYSFELGSLKPDVACYRLVLQQAGINASETIFIDDNVQNIEGAKSAGLEPILLQPGIRIENLGLEKKLENA